MERFVKLFFVLVFITVVVGCGSGSDSWDTSLLATAGVQEATFVDKGAVVPNPIQTIVTIDADTIKYSQTQSDQVINEWSKPIQSADFRSMRKIITDNKLYLSEDVLPSGQFPCLGSNGMTISIKKDNDVHSFAIDGGVYCNSSQWPAGVRELVELKDALVQKYSGQ